AMMITIGDTFFFNSHMHSSVSSNGTNPGIREFKLSCRVVTFSGVSDSPDAYCCNAVWIPSAPDGRLLQSMYAPSLSCTVDTTGVKLMLTHRSINAPRTNIPRIDAPFVTFCRSPPERSSVILVPTLYPNSCVYHMNAQRITFHNTKNRIGPR